MDSNPIDQVPARKAPPLSLCVERLCVCATVTHSKKLDNNSELNRSIMYQSRLADNKPSG